MERIELTDEDYLIETRYGSYDCRWSAHPVLILCETGNAQLQAMYCIYSEARDEALATQDAHQFVVDFYLDEPGTDQLRAMHQRLTHRMSVSVRVLSGRIAAVREEIESRVSRLPETQLEWNGWPIVVQPYHTWPFPVPGPLPRAGLDIRPPED